MTDARNVRMSIAYDGAPFSGFQRQPGRPFRTVQGELEAVLGSLLDEPIRLWGAGRTDTGVHATAQVVNFFTRSGMNLEAMRRALNMMLHGDIVVRTCEAASPGFNARHDALSRIYQYLIFNAPDPPAVLGGYLMHVWMPLDLPAMQEAAAGLVGSHDFLSFCSSGGHLEKTRRTVLRLHVREIPSCPALPGVAAALTTGRLVCLEIEANGFLPRMVRMIVGTLLRVGKRELHSVDVRRFLHHPIAGSAGPPAPPQGLTLVDVQYPNDEGFSDGIPEST